MKFQKFDSMFFIGLLMAFGTIITFLAIRQTITIGTQLTFVSGLGFGVLGIWFVMQNAQKIMTKAMDKHFAEKRKKAT